MLVREALDAYLQDLDPDEVYRLLRLQGVLSEDEAREMRSRIHAARATWRASAPDDRGSPSSPS